MTIGGLSSIFVDGAPGELRSLFRLLPAERQVQAVRSMADSCTSLRDISEATGLTVECIERVLRAGMQQ